MIAIRPPTLRPLLRACALALGTLLTAALQRPSHAAEVFFVADCLEAPDALLIGADTRSYPGGVAVRDPVFSNLAPCSSLPATVGGEADEYYSGQVAFELSSDGGVNWSTAHAPVTFQLRIRYAGPTGPDTRRFDTGMLLLDISGGTLPYTRAFRESPTHASTGVTTIRAVPGGVMIDGFFDVYTELNLDGDIWYPAPQSAHLMLSSESVTKVSARTWGAIKTLAR